MSDADPPTPIPPVLPYHSPQPREPRGNPALAVLVGLLGAVAGLFGALMLFYGCIGIWYVCTKSVRRDLPGDLFEMGMFLLIGGFCEFIAVRWCRSVARISAGR
jgi:membrane associated rhomboid family serine protease